jgi:hypothetical protein
MLTSIALVVATRPPGALHLDQAGHIPFAILSSFCSAVKHTASISFSVRVVGVKESDFPSYPHWLWPGKVPNSVDSRGIACQKTENRA